MIYHGDYMIYHIIKVYYGTYSYMMSLYPIVYVLPIYGRFF